jgi:hypothetical protein
MKRKFRLRQKERKLRLKSEDYISTITSVKTIQSDAEEVVFTEFTKGGEN